MTDSTSFAFGGASAETSAAPAFTLGQIIDQLRTSWGGAYENTYRAWFSSTVTYSIADYYPANAPYGEVTAYTMTAVMKNTARLGFELWDDAIAINLDESVNNPAANITMNRAAYTYDANGNLSTSGGTYARPTLNSGPVGGYYPIQAEQIWLNANWSTHDQDSDFYFGGYGVATYVHEIGHTLGLSHPGSYNAGGNPVTYLANAEFAQDNREYTIMSYFGGYNANTNSWTQDGTDASWYYPSTPMVYDIAAIQATYGADYTTRAGDSTYGFNITADVASRSANGLCPYSFTQNSHPIFTIWDGGGNDTLDCSGYGNVQLISLAPGSYSSIGGMNGNIAIAFGCYIERAIGGSNNDFIFGNEVNNYLDGRGGANAIYGFGGNDYITATGSNNTAFGGEGSDQLYFTTNSNQLYGENGNDWIGANGNANALVGGNGDDYLTGRGNSNTLVGEAGNDQMNFSGDGNVFYGDDGADFIYVSSGNSNTLYGGNGNDWLGLNGNNNTQNGGAGNDWIGASGTGNSVSGGGGGDTLFAYGFTNYLYSQDGVGGGTWLGVSGSGNFLVGNAGNDWLGATGNNNTFDPGAGNDAMVAAAHTGDIFVFKPGYGHDNITGFAPGNAATDVIDLRAFHVDYASLMTSYVADVAGNAVIHFGADDLTLISVTKAQLTAGDFLLA